MASQTQITMPRADLATPAPSTSEDTYYRIALRDEQAQAILAEISRLVGTDVDLARILLDITQSVRQARDGRR